MKDPQTSKRVVVVGGTGHISGSLVDALVAAGHDVTVFVRGLGNRHLPEGVRTITGDRNDREAFELTMRRQHFDAAFDMICWGPEDAESDVRAFAEVGHFFQTSTVCTIGGPLAAVPANESTPLRPVSDYGRGKVRADEVFLDAYRRDGFPVTVLKPANTWGAGMPLVRQLGFDPHWIDRVRDERPILIAGDGRQCWSLCHVEDAVQAYAALLGQPQAIGETYLLTSPEHTDWIDYHSQIAALLGVAPHFVEAPAEDLLRLWPEATGILGEQSQWDQCYDVGKLQKAVPSFQPRLTLRERGAGNIEWIEADSDQALARRETDPRREDEVIRRLGLG
jgi:nucleoside-diphosphate-sugar epimerase